MEIRSPHKTGAAAAAIPAGILRRLCLHLHEVNAIQVVRLGPVLLCLLTLGCQKETPAGASMPIPEVTVATPVEKKVQEYERFTGRTVAEKQVEIRARVSGYLIKAPFKPGSEVKKGSLLFEIDPRPYKSSLERTQAEIKQADARAKRLGSDYERAQRLRATNAISQEDFDKVAGDRAEAVAAVEAVKAKVSGEKLSLEWTTILAPMDGRVGDRLVDVGNLVTGGQGFTTLLTTIVSLDPMSVAFDVEDTTLQRIQEAVRDGKITLRQEDHIPVEMGLDIHKTSYPLNGTINFLNNQVDPKTGTIRVKAEFRNPKPDVGERVLIPGMYARLRVPIGAAHKELLLPESALGTDQGKKFLYAVTDQKNAIRLEATVGLLLDGWRVVESVQDPDDKQPRALRPDERIIVKGLQRVRPGRPVDPKPAKGSQS